MFVSNPLAIHLKSHLAREKAQRVKWLLCKHQDQSSASGICFKRLGVGMVLLIPALGKGDGWILGVPWSTSADRLSSSKSMRNTGGPWGRAAEVDCWPPHKCTNMNTYPHVHIQVLSCGKRNAYYFFYVCIVVLLESLKLSCAFNIHAPFGCFWVFWSPDTSSICIIQKNC